MVGVVAQESLASAPLNVRTLLGAVAILAVAYALSWAVTRVVNVLSERFGTRRISVKMFAPAVKFGIYGAATYYILGPILQLTSTQLLAISGLIGAALGFGLKDLVTDAVGGLVIIFEKPYRVGDKVRISGSYGEVVDVGLRSTRLVTPGDDLVSLPNDFLFAEGVSNANAGAAEMMVTVELYVDPDADTDRAADLLREAIVTSPFVYVTDERPVTVLVEAHPGYQTLRGKAYVKDLREEFDFESDVTERALDAFAAAGIETPNLPMAARRPEQ